MSKKSVIENLAIRLGFALDAATKEKVADEQVRMVWSHATVATVVASAFAVVAALHLMASVEHQVVQTWLALKLLVATPRVIQSQIFRLRGFPSGTVWRRRTYQWLALDGAVWGIAGFGLMGSDINTASLVTASLCCVACVATFGFQVNRLATAAYVVPIIVPMMLGMLNRNDAFGFYGAAGLSLFLVQVLITASRSDSKLSEVFLLRIHSTRISAEKDEALALVQRQSAVKSQFLGTVSHELRTPIHGMLGIARVVHVQSTDAQLKKQMELIEASGTHLLGLVTDLIDVSRIEAGQMRVHQVAFDLAIEIERFAGIYAVRASEKGLTFVVESQVPKPYWVLGDPARVRQVLHNLMGNAIKFTEVGSVQLIVGSEKQGDHVQFEVRDTGIGISVEDQKVVFHAFEQIGSNVEGRRQGTGLGLTIAREIAELLGGSLTLTSRPGAGSTFNFSVPLASTSEPRHFEIVDRLAGEAPLVSARILLAEDNDVNFIIASSMLTNQGHQVERASDGAEAVSRALREIDRPDLVLMDCMMPTMDGFDATRSIRAQELAMGLARIPIIAVSAIIDEEVARDALNSGMDDALGKPFASDDLRKVIHPWLPRAAVATRRSVMRSASLSAAVLYDA